MGVRFGLIVIGSAAALQARPARGSFDEHEAREALAQALETSPASERNGEHAHLAALVDEYLAQHDAQPETIEKRAAAREGGPVIGERRLGELRPPEIAAWRTTICRGTGSRRRRRGGRSGAGGRRDDRPTRRGTASRTHSGGATEERRSSPGLSGQRIQSRRLATDRW